MATAKTNRRHIADQGARARARDQASWRTRSSATATPTAELTFPSSACKQAMPTGGFILKGAGNLWKDLKAGLIGLTLRQIRDLKQRSAGRRRRRRCRRCLRVFGWLGDFVQAAYPLCRDG